MRMCERAFGVVNPTLLSTLPRVPSKESYCTMKGTGRVSTMHDVMGRGVYTFGIEGKWEIAEALSPPLDGRRSGSAYRSSFVTINTRY